MPREYYQIYSNQDVYYIVKTISSLTSMVFIKIYFSTVRVNHGPARHGKVSYGATRLKYIYCTSGDIREVLIFANLASRKNSWIQESRKNYYNIAPKKNEKSRILNFLKSPQIINSQNFEYAKINRSIVCGYSAGIDLSR